MKLDDYRAELDAIDKTLEEGFIRRMETVKKIGEYKAEHGLPTLDAGREAAVIDMHTENCPDELKPYMAYYFKVLMALSRNLQEQLAVERSRKE